MKILQVIPSLATGGAEVFVVSLCNALAEMGHEVTLLTFYPRDESQFLYKRINSRVNVKMLPKRKGVDLLLSFKLNRFIRKGRFDVVNFHVQSIIYALVPCMFTSETKYVATIHNDAFKEAAGLHRNVRRFLFKHKKMMPVTISDESRLSFENLYKQSSTMIYNGVSIDSRNDNTPITQVDYRHTSKTKIFAYVASVNEVKNQLNAAKAFNILAKEGYDTVLLIAGRLNDSDYCKLVKAEESDNVIVLGQIDNPVKLMTQSDFFMLVSHYEGMPISLLEAMYSHLIPIVTPVGGNVNLVKDGENGIICRGCDIDSIKKSVIRVLSLGEHEIKSMHEQLEEMSDKYSINTCASNYLKLYKSLQQ